MSPETSSSSSNNSFERDDVRTGAIFTNADNIQCRVDRVENGRVHLTVLNNKTIDGKHELSLPIADMTSDWKLTKKAAA